MADVVGAAEHYGQFIELLRARIDELDITYATVGEMCGFTEGYINSIFCGSKVLSIYSLFTLSKALALDVYFHHDDDDLNTLQKRAEWVKNRRAGAKHRGERGGVVHFNNNLNFYRKIGRIGAKRKNSQAKNFREWGRKGAAKRWKKKPQQHEATNEQ